MKSLNFTLTFLIAISLFTSAFALASSHRQAVPCQKVKYTSGLLALTWLGEYCTESRCSNDWQDFWDGTSFVIHGFWPQSDDPAFLTCLRQDGYDKFCMADYTFNENKLSPIKSDLNKFWPQIGSKKNFWKYQWDKHGTCYLRNTLDSFNPGKLSSDDIFFRYFRGTVNKLKNLALQNIKTFTFNSKEELAKELKLKPSQFMAVCGKDQQLDEIRVCFNIAEPQKEKIIDCTKMGSECRYPVVLKPEQPENL